MSDEYKDVEVNKRKWRLTKFDAMTGAKVIKKLLPVVATLFAKADVKNLKPEEVNTDFARVVSALTDIKDDDFEYIQKACLRVTSEHLGAGVTPVLNDNESFGVIGLEHDTMTVLALTVHALMFNVTGFFADTPLDSFVGGIMNTFKQNLPT